MNSGQADATASAALAADANRQPARAVPAGDQLGEGQLAPAITAQAVRGELVLVLEQAGE